MIRVLDWAEERLEAGGHLVSAHPITVENGVWAPFAWLKGTATLLPEDPATTRT